MKRIMPAWGTAALLGSALTLHGGPDRPLRRAEAPAAVTGCESFGPNFKRLEGTDSCIRLGGSVRVEQSVTTGSGDSLFPGAGRR